MATLRLVWVQCNNLAPGQTLTVQPIFLRTTLGTPVQVTSASPQAWFTNAVTPPFNLVGGFIELQVNGTAIYKSDDYIWDTDVTSEDTGFVLVSDSSGADIEYSFTLFYQLNTGFFSLLLNTIGGIGLRLALFVRSLFTLIFNPPKAIRPPNPDQTPPRKSPRND